jgi:hypothetical protein
MRQTPPVVSMAVEEDPTMNLDRAAVARDARIQALFAQEYCRPR